LKVAQLANDWFLMLGARGRRHPSRGEDALRTASDFRYLQTAPLPIEERLARLGIP